MPQLPDTSLLPLFKGWAQMAHGRGEQIVTFKLICLNYFWPPKKYVKFLAKLAKTLTWKFR